MNRDRYIFQAMDEINKETHFAHDVAGIHGQSFHNIKGTEWFLKAVANQIREDEETELRFRKLKRR